MNRKQATFEETLKIEYAIREYAHRFCFRHKLDLKAIINTHSKKKQIVRSRRQLILNIKLRMAVQNKHIASALGLTAATVSLALVESRKGVVL